jgi:hypothetical protein
MSDHAISMLRKRREEMRHQIHQAETRVTNLRRALANLDAALAILTPDDPGYVEPRRRYRRGAYFKRGELSRLVREALRDASKPLAAGEIAAGIVAAKQFPESAHPGIAKMVLCRLRILGKEGAVAKTGTTRDARWAVSQ